MEVTSESPLKMLSRLGQSPWLDFMQRSLLRSGELAGMLERWSIRGVTTNPAIFENAISHSSDYRARIDELSAAGWSPDAIYEDLVLDDVAEAADILRGVYDLTRGADGFVSVEVSPRLVHDAAGTVAEARRFWALLDRPNVMIKVPATAEGLPAIRRLIGEGINVNVTLLFSLTRYREVVEAYLGGLEDAAAAGRSLASIASVASIFLSRIDTMVDARLDELASGADGKALRSLEGEAAIACARCAYAMYCDVVETERFRALADRGARSQRLLWASTGTKNPDYSDVKYIEPLIAPDTVSTMPLQTLEAYDGVGEPAIRLTGDDSGPARETLAALERAGIDVEEVAGRLLEQGIVKFADPFEALHAVLARG